MRCLSPAARLAGLAVPPSPLTAIYWVLRDGVLYGIGRTLSSTLTVHRYLPSAVSHDALSPSICALPCFSV